MFRKSIVIHLEHCSFCSQQRCPFFHPWRDCPRILRYSARACICRNCHDRMYFNNSGFTLPLRKVFTVAGIHFCNRFQRLSATCVPAICFFDLRTNSCFLCETCITLKPFFILFATAGHAWAPSLYRKEFLWTRSNSFPETISSEHSWSQKPPNILQMKMVVVVDFQNSTAMIEMSPKHRPNQQINPKWCHYTSPHDFGSIMCASPRNVIIPTPERKPHDLRSIMCASPRNVIIPTPERKPHDLRSIGHVCKSEERHHPHPTPPHDLRSIDHVCKSEERHHPHPTPPHPTPRETSRVRSIKHVCKSEERHHPHPTPPHPTPRETSRVRSIKHVCKCKVRHHPHPTPPHPERNILFAYHQTCVQVEETSSK